MWRFDTLESVYDPCLLVGAAGEGTHDLLVWDVEGVYLLGGRSGLAREGFADVSGAAALMTCNLYGTTTPALVHIAVERPRVTAWSFQTSSDASSSGPGDEPAAQDGP